MHAGLRDSEHFSSKTNVNLLKKMLNTSKLSVSHLICIMGNVMDLKITGSFHDKEYPSINGTHTQ